LKLSHLNTFIYIINIDICMWESTKFQRTSLSLTFSMIN